MSPIDQSVVNLIDAFTILVGVVSIALPVLIVVFIWTIFFND